MLVIVVNNVPPALRGRLALWFLEVRAGVYVGRASARHRDRVWDTVVGHLGDGDAVMVEPDSSRESGFRLRTAGTNRRTPVDLEGLTLVSFLPAEDTETAVGN